MLRRENELAEKENKISKTTAELDTKKADCELAVAEKEALKKAITDVTKQHEVNPVIYINTVYQICNGTLMH